jgi:hypothetical protein
VINGAIDGYRRARLDESICGAEASGRASTFHVGTESPEVNGEEQKNSCGHYGLGYHNG